MRVYDEIASETIASLNLSDEAGWDELLRRVESTYGKPIRFRHVSQRGWASVTGLWLDKPDHGEIFVLRHKSRLFREFTIYHEFGHILRNDRSCRVLSMVDRQRVPRIGLRQSILDAQVFGLFSDPRELAAEHIAYALARRFCDHRRPNRDEVFG